MVVRLLLVVALIAGNFLFVAAEFAITRARPTEVAELEAEGARGVKSLADAVRNLDAYLSACQLGVTLCSIGLGFAGEPAVGRLLEPVLAPLGEWAGVSAFTLSFAVAYGLVSMLHVVVGELAPKSLAIARTRRTGLALAPALRAFYLATKPLTDLFNWLGNLVLKPFGIPPASEAGHAPHSEDELRRLLRESGEEGLIEPEEREFTENVLTFGDRHAGEVMVPRETVRFLTTDQRLDEALDEAGRAAHTRFPLCEPHGGLDAVVGVIHVKDLVRAARHGGELHALARPVLRVPEPMLLDDLLDELRRERQHLALVVGDDGTVRGVVTLEDVLEEIVGEIADEFDPEGDGQVAEVDGGLVVAGSAPLEAVVDRLGLELDGAHAPTIGGHAVELLGRVPEPGEQVEVGGRRAEVLAVDQVRVTRLRFDRPDR